MQEPQTWRELLGNIIRDPQEKQRLANELRIGPIALRRWVNGQVKPHPQKLQELMNALPQYRQVLLELIGKEFQDFIIALEEISEDTSQEIPSAFYTRVLSAYSTTPHLLRSSSISSLILQQALAHLDPNKQGMSITVVLCSTPRQGDKVRSLREMLGRGTFPWKSHLDDQARLLGYESLAGYAVTTFRFVVNQNIKEGQTFFPVLRTEYEESAAACPLLQANRVAGCLLVASHKANYFTPARQALIQNYANLMVLACEPEGFYDQQSIELGIMPSFEAQQPYFAHFQQRITDLMVRIAAEGYPMTRAQAELEIWLQLEEEFLRLSEQSKG
jgi:hypothetical protein